METASLTPEFRVGATSSPGRLATVATSEYGQNQWRWAPHLRMIDRAIVNAVTGWGPKLAVIEAPPRHGKSQLISKWLPAWFLAHHPGKRVALTSYADDFAKWWGRQTRYVLEECGHWFPEPIEISVEQHASSDWEIMGHAGGMVTAGTGGQLVGRGADLFILDDPLKSAEEAVSEKQRDNLWDWWQSVAERRLEPGAAVVVTGCRWHEDDLIGRVLAQHPDARRIQLKAIAEDDDELGRQPGEALWPERWPIEELERIRESVDGFWWLAQYQQRPGRGLRSEWPSTYFDNLSAPGWPTEFAHSVIAVDPSKGRATGDYSAIVFAGSHAGRIYVDASIERRPAEQIVADTVRMYRAYRPDFVAIESNAFQELLGTMFHTYIQRQNLLPVPIALVENRINKEVRIGRLGPWFESGRIAMRDKSDGSRLLIRQLKEWPNATYDDGPDALEMALRSLQHEPHNVRELVVRA